MWLQPVRITVSVYLSAWIPTRFSWTVVSLTFLSALTTISLDLAWYSHGPAHSARSIPTLHQLRPNLPIYSSAATRELLGANFLRVLPEGENYELRPHLQARIFRAGHLPGAAAIFLTYQGMQRCQSLLYVSDFFLSSTRCTDGLALEELGSLLLIPDWFTPIGWVNSWCCAAFKFISLLLSLLVFYKVLCILFQLIVGFGWGWVQKEMENC